MLRDEWNKRYGEGDDPIVINSGYRSWEVNKRAGGSATSNHLVGRAADIRVAWVRSRLYAGAAIPLDIADNASTDFDELIIEAGSTVWLHFAVRLKDNRRKVVFWRSENE